jgi:hypothetical protein
MMGQRLNFARRTVVRGAEGDKEMRRILDTYVPPMPYALCPTFTNNRLFLLTEKKC